jgi:hypothetical protein
MEYADDVTILISSKFLDTLRASSGDYGCGATVL